MRLTESRRRMETELGIRFRWRVSMNEQGRRQERLPFSVDANSQCTSSSRKEGVFQIPVSLSPIRQCRRERGTRYVSPDAMFATSSTKLNVVCSNNSSRLGRTSVALKGAIRSPDSNKLRASFSPLPGQGANKSESLGLQSYSHQRGPATRQIRKDTECRLPSFSTCIWCWVM